LFQADRVSSGENFEAAGSAAKRVETGQRLREFVDGSAALV
jgi:hypothetical protein